MNRPIPPDIHPVAQRALELLDQGLLTVEQAAFICNMVSSNLIPLVECMLGVGG